MDQLNIYEPIFTRIPCEPMDLSYYEIRIWKHHILIETNQFDTLKQARKYYKKKNLDIEEDDGSCYVEIIHVKPLKKINN